MTPDDFRTHLDRLNYSQAGFARRMGIEESKCRRWARGVYPVPVSIQMLLRGETLEPAGPDNAKRKDG